MELKTEAKSNRKFEKRGNFSIPVFRVVSSATAPNYIKPKRDYEISFSLAFRSLALSFGSHERFSVFFAEVTDKFSSH
jgi:hypothetical protein